jgi:hypothetical protein
MRLGGAGAPWSPGAKGFSLLFAASLLAGFGWEALNYPSLTGWHYLILPSVPHLFQMPWPGYIGFLPFTLSIVVLHEWHRRLVPSVMTALVLYAAGFTGLHALTVLYQQHGLWVFY